MDSKDDLAPFYSRRNELTVLQGCLLWGNRIIVPPKYQKMILEELHISHLGIVKMKSLARSYVWWPKLNEQIEEQAKQCLNCQMISSNPSLALLQPWIWPNKAWQRLHVDFAGPFKGHMFIVIIDAYSKWPEVKIMNSTTATATISVLRELFSRFGLCEQLVSDNGPQFTSSDFKEFMRFQMVLSILPRLLSTQVPMGLLSGLYKHLNKF